MTLTLFQKTATTIAAAGLGLTCLHADAAQAALLHFSFTTDGDGTGSFLLNTDTVPSGFAPPLFDEDGGVLDEGVYFPGAVSNFTFSSALPEAESFAYPNLNIDFVVFPNTPFLQGVTAGIGPLECSLPTNTCPIQLLVDYRGSLATLPKLSSDPNDYSLYSVFGYPDGDVTFNAKVTPSNAAGVPEPTVIPGVLAAGAIGGFVRRRLQMRQKRA
ncbi:MAG: PEP-CTERM sorting domain-containing protein [Leptolyngbya sp. BL-A-14]